MTDLNPASVAGPSSQNSLNTSQSSGQALSGLADQFDTFLTLLTTQLQNQDPLEPMDSHEFTNQLVLFTQAEQDIKQNENLEELISANSQAVTASAVNYIGTTVEVDGNQGNHLGSGFRGSIDFDTPPAAVDIKIQAEDGTVVYEESHPRGLPDGEHQFNWNGSTLDGQNLAPLGTYSVITSAQNAAGDGVAGQTKVANTVTGVEMDESGVTLVMGDQTVALDRARSISVPGL